MENDTTQKLLHRSIKIVLTDMLQALNEEEVGALVKALDKVRKYIPLSILSKAREIRKVLYNPDDEYLIVETSLLKISIADKMYDNILHGAAYTYYSSIVEYLQSKYMESNVYKILYDEDGIELYNNDSLMILLVWMANDASVYATLAKHKK